jgi:type I restriction enzyme, S subunit
MDNWRHLVFSQAVMINPRIALKRGIEYPFVEMSEIQPGQKYVLASVTRAFNGGGAKFSSGDTLMARITPCLENGKIAHFWNSQNCSAYGSTEFIVLRGKDGISDNQFVYYLTISQPIRAFVIGQMIGTSGRQRVPTNAFDFLEIDLPPLPEQRAIARILSSLDDKIELNRQTNQTLESIAQALFKDWFVDFGPVRTKSEGGQPYLAPEIWELFPDKLDDEGKPVGWETRTLASVTCEIRRGISPKYIEQGGVCVLNQKCIRNHIVSLSSARRHDYNAKNIIGRELTKGDILVNSTGVGTLGRVAQIWTIPETTIVDSHVTIIRAANKNLSIYLGINIMQRESEIEHLGEGSTGQTELSRLRLGEMKVLIPDQKILVSFDEMTDSLIKISESNNTQSQTLAQTRDLLLPKLMSGEIRVKDAEKIAETLA